MHIFSSNYLIRPSSVCCSKNLIQYGCCRRVCLLGFGEEDGTDRRKQILVNECQARAHGVVADNLSVQGGHYNSPVSEFGQILVAVGIHGDIGLQCNARFSLHDVNVFVDGSGENFLYGSSILFAAVDNGVVFLDLDQTLNDELLQ